METKQLYCGIDIHKDNYVACLMDEMGNEIKKCNFTPSLDEIKKFSIGVPIKQTTIIIENCGMWRYAYRNFKELGYKVILAESTSVKKIVKAKKNDVNDAKALADLKRTNFLPELHIPSEEILNYRDIIHHLINIREMITKTKIRIKSELIKHGIKYKDNIWNLTGISWLKCLKIQTITSLVKIYEFLIIEEKDKHNQVKKISNKLPQTKLLMTIPGIAEYLALLMYSEISEIKRFSSYPKLVMYSGLCPGFSQTGNSEHQVRNHAVNKTLKRGFYQSSSRAMLCKKDNIFKTKYLKSKNQKDMPTARRVIAKHMAIVVWNILTRNEEFKY